MLTLLNQDSWHPFICLMCKKEVTQTQKCNSHLLPDWISKELRRQGGDQNLMLIKKDGTSPRDGGLTDDRILCRSCDQHIGSYDGHAKRVLMSTVPESFITEGFSFLFIPGVDADKLQLFALSVVLRFDFSNKLFAQDINLGVYRDRFLSAVKDRNPAVMRELPVFLYQQRSSNQEIDRVSRGSVFAPKLYRGSNLNPNHYEITVPRGFVFKIKTDKRRWNYLSTQELARNGGLNIPIVTREETGIFKGAAKLITANSPQ